jgi:hypothetical protein
MGATKMYTGTLINDLMNTVEQVERDVRRNSLTENAKMPFLLDLRDPAVAMKPFLVGAA